MQWWPTLLLAVPLTTVLLEASYSDLTTRKVPNKLIVLYMGVAVAVQMLVVVLWRLGVDGADVPLADGLGRYVVYWLVNSALCVGAGIGMWWVGLWPAGEAKLFGVVGLLFPLWWIQRPLSAQFLGLSILHNIFLVIFFHTLLDVVVQAVRWRTWREKLSGYHPHKDPFDLKKTLRTLVGFVFLFLFVRLVRMEIMGEVRKLPMDTSLIYLLMVFFFHQIHHVFSKPWAFWGAAAVITVYAGYETFYLGTPENLLHLVSMSGYAASIIAIRFAYDYYAKVMNVRPIPVEDLAQGMVLSTHTQRTIREDAGFYELNIEEFFADGLTEHQAANIKRWNAETDTLGDTVWVAHTTPIAPLIALGTLLTAVAQGTVPIQDAVAWLTTRLSSLF